MSEPYSILFVCTGNVFRSMTAEYVCRRIANPYLYRFHSAGTEGHPSKRALPHVYCYLQSQGLETVEHSSRSIDANMIFSSSLVIAMNYDHQDFLLREYGIQVPCFMEVATGDAQALPDLCDIFYEYEEEDMAVKAHIKKVISTIQEAAPTFIENLPIYLSKTDRLPL
jgi:protein-tyrosine phosphatase